MRRPRPIATFLEGPSSIRNTIRVLVAATIAMTFIGGVVVRVVAPEDFSNLGDALWWSLQTVTTVGYGDITPKSGVGRTVGGVFVVYGVAFLSILTAAVTATFIEHARRKRRPGEPDLDTVVDRLDEIAGRLDQLEQRLGEREQSDRSRGT